MFSIIVSYIKRIYISKIAWWLMASQILVLNVKEETFQRVEFRFDRLECKSFAEATVFWKVSVEDAGNGKPDGFKCNLVMCHNSVKSRKPESHPWRNIKTGAKKKKKPKSNRPNEQTVLTRHTGGVGCHSNALEEMLQLFRYFTKYIC